MLLFLISCFSFLLLSKVGLRLWAFPSFLFCIFVPLFTKGMFFTPSFEIPRMFPYTHKNMRPKREILEETKEFSLLDLPDLPLDSILDKLNPSELCSMARVCCFLREKCTSDHFWSKHFKQKWGGVVGDSFYREWQCYVASRRVPRFLNSRVQKGGFSQLFYGIFLKKLQMKERDCVSRCFLPVNSVMSCYLALETGKFWFPAQVFNREVQNGHIGFVLSCYDAKLSYDSTSDNFVARYPSHGKSMIEEDIEWDRIRAPSVDTPANATHVSTCLDELKPDDHVEIQWRRNKEFPYGSFDRITAFSMELFKVASISSDKFIFTPSQVYRPYFLFQVGGMGLLAILNPALLTIMDLIANATSMISWFWSSNNIVLNRNGGKCRFLGKIIPRQAMGRSGFMVELGRFARRRRLKVGDTFGRIAPWNNDIF